MPITVSGGMTLGSAPMQGRLGRQQHERFIALTREIYVASEIDKVKRPSRDVLARKLERVRSAVGVMFQLNRPTVALNASVTGSFSRTGYSVEKVLFQSLTNWWVSANLYLPDGASANNKVPGIVEYCGHDPVGKANAAYQSAAIGLAKLGFAVLVVDVVGQGERKQVPSTPVEEHRLIGQQIPLTGWSLAGLQTWDGMRAIDYLVSRPEINTNHIGVFGQSGGGTQAVWVLANDPRVTMAAVSCGMTSALSVLENEVWGDPEQTPPRMLEYGIDFDDIFATFAPKPLLIAAKELDLFDKRGVERVHLFTQKVYARKGAANKLRIYFGPGGHGMPTASREQIYQWFKFAVTGIDAAVVEPSITPETEATLLVTATGNVSEIGGAIKTQQLYTSLADAEVAARTPANAVELRKRVSEVLRIDWPAPKLPHYRTWLCYSGWVNTGETIEPAITPPNYPKSSAQIYVVETEPGILCPMYHVETTTFDSWPIQPVAQGTQALLFIPHLSADQELSQQARPAFLNAVIAGEPSSPLFAIDPRGFGESKPMMNATNTPNFHAQTADMLNMPMLGRMVTDILRCVDLLAAAGYKIHIVGNGNGTIPASIVALLHPAVVKTRLENALTRWYACTKALPDQMAWQQPLLPRDVLRHFDLPDIYAALGATLTSTNPWGAWQGLGGET